MALKATVEPLLGKESALPLLPGKCHTEPLRATQAERNSEKPQQVTATYFEPLKCHVSFSNAKFAGDRGPALARSRVTGVRPFHVRGGFCSRIVLGRVPWSVVPLARAFTAPTTATHTSRFEKTCYTPMVAHKNHGLTHRRTATVPSTVPAHMVQSDWWCYVTRITDRSSSSIVLAGATLALQHVSRAVARTQVAAKSAV